MHQVGLVTPNTNTWRKHTHCLFMSTGVHCVSAPLKDTFMESGVYLPVFSIWRIWPPFPLQHLPCKSETGGIFRNAYSSSLDLVPHVLQTEATRDHPFSKQVRALFVKQARAWNGCVHTNQLYCTLGSNRSQCNIFRLVAGWVLHAATIAWSTGLISVFICCYSKIMDLFMWTQI